MDSVAKTRATLMVGNTFTRVRFRPPQMTLETSWPPKTRICSMQPALVVVTVPSHTTYGYFLRFFTPAEMQTDDPESIHARSIRYSWSPLVAIMNESSHTENRVSGKKSTADSCSGVSQYGQIGSYSTSYHGGTPEPGKALQRMRCTRLSKATRVRDHARRRG